MNSVLIPWEKTHPRIVRNPHFWAIFVIIIVLALIYYRVGISYDNRLPWISKLEIFEFNYRMHGILFSIPFIYAVFIFWWRGALLTWFISVAITIPRILYFHYDTHSVVINVLYLLMPMIAVFYISIELNWRKKERKVLAEREAERQEYMSQIFKAQENERQRLARELHDDTTQTLLVIATRAQALSSYENVKSMPQSKEQAEWIKNTALSVSDELRRLSQDLRPGILDNLGLIPALRWLVTGLSQDNINARIEIKGITRTLSPEADINIFRIVQEALNNIRRHSKATEVSVNMEYSPDTINLMIQDNGIGFSLPRTTSDLTSGGKLGLAGMQQRVNFLNGVFILDSEPGKGVNISIVLKV